MKFTTALSLLAITFVPAVLAAPTQSSSQSSAVPVLFRAVRNTNTLKCPTLSTDEGCTVLGSITQGQFFDAFCEVNRQFVLLVSNDADQAQFVATADIIQDDSAAEAHKVLANCDDLL